MNEGNKAARRVSPRTIQPPRWQSLAFQHVSGGHTLPPVPLHGQLRSATTKHRKLSLCPVLGLTTPELPTLMADGQDTPRRPPRLSHRRWPAALSGTGADGPCRAAGSTELGGEAAPTLPTPCRCFSLEGCAHLLICPRSSSSTPHHGPVISPSHSHQSGLRRSTLHPQK